MHRTSFSPRPPLFVAGLLALLLGAAGGGCAGDDDPTPPRSVTLSGVAFEFGASTGISLDRARIGVAERPELEVTTDATGFYSLSLPAGEPATLYIDAGGAFPLMHLQTFTPEESLPHVNFQTVPQLFYDMFAGALGAEPDPGRCQISATVNVAAVWGLPLEDFFAYGHHGIAGATVSIEPPVDPYHGPIYFSDRTIPDRALTETTIDGGVVFFNLEPGIYTISATHPDVEIASFVATCTPGRFINAGPPQGLAEIDTAP